MAASSKEDLVEVDLNLLMCWLREKADEFLQASRSAECMEAADEEAVWQFIDFCEQETKARPAPDASSGESA